MYQRNLKLFTWFRALFTSRFYYPIYTILFLDMGLTIEEFALLNTLWAATIVFAEVPSGALADTWGRKKLLVATSVLMIFELLALIVCPIGRTPWLLPLMALNRLCSGLAEAAASGADEALAYDSLVELKREGEWNKTLARTSRVNSVFMLGCMIVGSIVYDQRLMAPLGLSKELIIKAPIILNMISAIACFFVAIGFYESATPKKESFVSEISSATRLTLETGLWILKSPVLVITLLFGLCFDNVISMFMTISTEYNRMIEIPISMMGFVGAAMSVLGFVTPSIAMYLTGRFSLTKNMLILFVVSLVGFVGLAQAWPYYGLVPSALLAGCMYVIGFMMSFYLNKFAPSEKRATVLSFRGLSFNIAYGFIGIVYAAYIKYVKEFYPESNSFLKGLEGFPYYLVVTFALTLVIAWIIRTMNRSKCSELKS